jgi:hypothetical protein
MKILRGKAKYGDAGDLTFLFMNSKLQFFWIARLYLLRFSPVIQLGVRFTNSY